MDKGIVYIKEAWAAEKQFDHLKPRDIPHTAKIFYLMDGYDQSTMGKKRSPLFLPEKFARYHILITGVRAERTKNITHEDCLLEGIIFAGGCYWTAEDGIAFDTSQDAYFALYDSINGKGSHENNWDWRYEFKFTGRDNGH